MYSYDEIRFECQIEQKNLQKLIYTNRPNVIILLFRLDKYIEENVRLQN